MRRLREIATLRAIPLGAAVISLFGSLSTAQAATHQVHIVNMKFVPEVLEIHAGDKVVWTNDDIVPHTVTAKANANEMPQFESGAITSGKTFTRKLRRAGVIDYVCSFHPTMKARIVVGGGNELPRRD